MDGDNCPWWNLLEPGAGAGCNMIATPVRRIDDEIVPVTKFVGEAAFDNAADDLAALAEAAELIFKLFGKAPAPAADRRRQSQRLKLPEPRKPDGMFRHVASARDKLAINFGRSNERPVDCGQPLGLDIAAHPLLD